MFQHIAEFYNYLGQLIVTAVSYTHLDVYKRQPSVSTDAARIGSAAFLLPAGTTVPLSGAPPVMMNLSMASVASTIAPQRTPRKPNTVACGLSEHAAQRAWRSAVQLRLQLADAAIRPRTRALLAPTDCPGHRPPAQPSGSVRRPS